MDYSKLEDPALINLVVRRNSEALGALYDRYGRLVYSLAIHIVGDEATAEEITQDVFTSVWEKAATYRVEQSKVSTWLSSITRYRAIDILRRRAARPERLSISWFDLEPIAPADSANTPAAAELVMLQQYVRTALHKLPDEQRQVVALAFFNGYTHTEIAEALREPLGTVKTRIRLGMQKLRQFFDENPLSD